MGTEEMEMEMVPASELWQQQVLELTKVSQAQRDPPLLWAVELSKCLVGAGIEIPSVELGQLLISHLCWSNNEPMFWKYLEHTIITHLVSPLSILSLLTYRVIPYRQPQPEAYRLYLALLSKYAFFSTWGKLALCQEKTIKAVDDALQLSQAFGTPMTGLGQTVVLFLFTVVCNLLNATAEDWGIQVSWSEKHRILTGSTGEIELQMDSEKDLNEKRHMHRECLRRTNSVMAIELIGKLMEHRKTSSLLRLAHRNILCEGEERLNGPSISIGSTTMREYIIGDDGYPLLLWIITPFWSINKQSENSILSYPQQELLLNVHLEG